MKKKRNIFLILFVCLFLSLAVTIRADSGWDGDYDSGSSWDTGGSSSWDWGSSSNDYTWGSSNTSHNRNNSSDLGGTFTIVIVFMTICAVITVVIMTTSKNETNTNTNRDFDQTRISYDINKIKEVLPNFDVNEFRKTTYEIYKNIQVAWMDFDYDTLKKYTTNELYNLYKSELMALKAKKQKNIMKNFSLLHFDIIDMEKSTDSISIKINMTIMCNDYVVDQNNNIARGNYRFVMYNYEMTFTCGISEKDNKCPNCNAPLENVQTSNCPYCDSTIISKNHDWVLSKKQVKYQRR